MPIYEYLCSKCAYIFEEFVGHNDPEAHAECPHCEAPTATRLPSAIGAYHIRGNNSASVRPRQAGAFKGKKK